YENLYYQRRQDRLHFCRPCIHTIGAHAVSEIIHLGPGAYSTQFPMERTIGDLGQEVRQPSNPFANLAQRALHRAQVTALKSIYPDLDADSGSSKLPQGSFDLGEGQVLLRPRDRTPDWTEGEEAELLSEYLDDNGVLQWARFRLSNGQIARSRYAEIDLYKKRKPRVTRNVKLRRNGITDFGEVWYYFLDENKHAYAMVSIYGRPDHDLLQQSSNALWACEYLGSQNLHVIPVSQLQSVVSMQPLPVFPHEVHLVGWWFVVQKAGIDDGLKTGYEEDM
ncbi:hypothetical protein EV360DRAFT_52925, partial [Lentinula raphanica]